MLGDLQLGTFVLLLWEGEEYYFQIDSHTIFTKGWDTKLKFTKK